MLTKKQQQTLKEHLERSQNPVFFYDNDADGLCSFLLLRRWLGRGKGVAVRSYPDLDVGYAKRAQDLRADAVFVLDKPVLSQAFVDEIALQGLPFIWIDHHAVQEGQIEKKRDNFFIYNPARNKGKNKSSEPVTFHVYQLTQRKEDLWIAMMGCIADHHLPAFAHEFAKLYPEFWSSQSISQPFDAYYGTEIGSVARALAMGLKDSLSHVVALQNFLIACKHPSDVLSEVETNSHFRATYQKIRGRYDRLLGEAQKEIDKKLIFFQYGGETSMSADLANELSYRNSGKVIAVAYLKGAVANISLRGKKIRGMLEKVLKQFPDAHGGGHEDAVGARVQTNDLARFREALEKEIGL